MGGGERTNDVMVQEEGEFNCSEFFRADGEYLFKIQVKQFEPDLMALRGG